MTRILFSLASAVLLILTFPTFDHGFLSWFALIPLFIATKDRNPLAAGRLCFVTGICFFMGVFYWINVIQGFTLRDFLVLGIYLGSYFGIFGLLLNFISQRTAFPPIITAPAVWTALEYLRSHAGFLALPWALLGHSQYLNLPLLQFTAFTGVYGISFLIVMVNVALSEAAFYLFSTMKPRVGKIHPIPIWSTVATLLCLGFTYLYGFLIIGRSGPHDTVSITVVQGNIPQELKWNPEHAKEHLEKHVRLSREAAETTRGSLIVWPETSVQGILSQNSYQSAILSTLAQETNAYLLVGGAQRPKFRPGESRELHRFNSAFLISPQGKFIKRYDKIHLLPFGEYLPYHDLIPWPEQHVWAAANFVPGKQYTVFDVNGAKFGVLICWESIFSDIFRSFVKNGARFMVNITNEAWFRDTAAPYQFLAMNVFRAVENRVAVARSGNTGVSCFIDPDGRIIGRVTKNNRDIFVEGHMTLEIPVSPGGTFYTFHGDVFAYLNLILAFLMMVSSSIVGPRNIMESN